MEMDKIVSIFQLDGEQREIAEIIGLDAYKKLVSHFGGSHIYVCKADTVLRDARNEEIYQKFNGYNYRRLALEYNLAEKTVREIVAECAGRKNKSNEQLKLF